MAQVLHFGCVGVVIFARDVGKENKIFMRSYVRSGIACELLTHIRRRRRRSGVFHPRARVRVGRRREHMEWNE